MNRRAILSRRFVFRVPRRRLSGARPCSVMQSARRRSGFSLMEVVVGLAIAVVLATALYASFSLGNKSLSAAADRAQRAATAASIFFELGNSIAAVETTNPVTSYLQTVGAYPSQLSQLITPITTADLNSCGRATDAYLAGTVPSPPVNPGYVNGWKGPYSTLIFAAGGSTQIASGFVTQDALLRIPTTPPNNPKAPELAGRLLIRMPSVTQADAQALDAAVDQTIDGTSGTVRYTATDPTTVDYEIRVSGC